MNNKEVYCEQKGRTEVKIGVKQVHIGQRLKRAVIVYNDQIKILDLISNDITTTIRRMAYPRTVKFSKCERFILASFTDNTVGIYCSRTGSQLSKINGVPRSTTSFLISDNSQKLLFGNNNTLCLWNISKGRLQMSSGQWKNIYCYAINAEGRQLVLGTYEGSLVILSIIAADKVAEISLKAHKSCVMLVSYMNRQIVSISYDKILLTTTIYTLNSGQKGVSYASISLEGLQGIPRSLTVAGNLPYLLQPTGIFWPCQDKLKGYQGGQYAVTEYEGTIIFLRQNQGVIEWFKK